MKRRGPLLARWRLTRAIKRREWNGGRCACWIDGEGVYICRNHRAPGSVMGAWALLATSDGFKDEAS